MIKLFRKKTSAIKVKKIEPYKYNEIYKMMRDYGERPYETYKRTFGKSWPGGDSEEIKAMVRRLGIPFRPGSSRANVMLQYRLLCGWRPDKVIDIY